MQRTRMGMAEWRLICVTKNQRRRGPKRLEL